MNGFAKSASVSYSQSEIVKVSQTGGNESVSDKGEQRSDCSTDSNNLRSPEMKKIGVIGSVKKIPLYGCSLTNGDQMRVTK